MLKLQRFTDAKEFVARAQDHLLEREAENHLLFGLAHDIGEGRYEEAFLATVEDADRIKLAALMTPPHNLVLSASDPEAVAFLGRGTRSEGIAVSGVGARTEDARAFVDAFGEPARRTMAQRIHKLERVRAPSGIPGSARRAGPINRNLIGGWLQGFGRDALSEESTAEDSLTRADRWLARDDNRGVLIWEDGAPVSMAGFSGPTPNGIRIGGVYTPPESRRQGYAGACVAELSRQLLEEGRRFCFLYTDLSNRTSNHIYAEIGYQPICDVDVYRFETPE